MGHSSLDPAFHDLRPWNEGRLLGAKRALRPQQVWAIRFWLDQHRRLRDRALFDLAIDSKLRGCDVVKVRIGDIVSGGRIRAVQFELVQPAQKTLLTWLERRGGTLNDYVLPSRNDYMAHMSTRQYARLVREWVTGIGLRPEDCGPHSLVERKCRQSTRQRYPSPAGPACRPKSLGRDPRCFGRTVGWNYEQR